MPLGFRRRLLLLIVAAVVLAGSAVHLYKERYFLRFVPLPLRFVEVLNTDSAVFPAFQDGIINGKVDLAGHDMKTMAGLRAMLNAIRAFSPLQAKTGTPEYTDITFDKWLREIRRKAFFCTDATQLFIAAAWAQGLKAREWHLLPPGWPPGQGHSVAEFFNPATQRWQLVDAQQAAIVRDRASGANLSMTDVLRRYRSGQNDRIEFDYGPYTEFFTRSDGSGLTAAYFFGQKLLSTPVLQLRQATWFARYPRQFVVSGHFVIGYAVVVDGWSHHPQVLWTKVSLIAFLLSAIALPFLVASVLRRRGAVS